MNKYILSLLIFQVLYTPVFSQDKTDTDSGNHTFRVMFYNVENYFDAMVDTTLTYNEFTPLGNLHWTKRKFEAKRNALSKVVTAVGGWSAIAIIGLVEVENDRVLNDLIENTPLNKKGYRFIHFDSPDFRGIDAALIYGPQFIPLKARPIPIIDSLDPAFATRDMLYVKGLLGRDTLHVVVNHWTSRYRGLLESEPKRMLQAQQLLQLTDSICFASPGANILVMGDFNDSPENASMMKLVRKGRNCTLKNLPLHSQDKNVKGTLKFQGNWNVFDQLLVSSNMTDSTNSLQVENDGGHIFTSPFILETDQKFGGVKPNRTNEGFKYHGGYSDHLPVFMDIKQIE